MFSYSTKRLVAMIFAAIIPGLVLLLGIFLLFCGTIFNVSFALAYLLAPLLTCGLFGLCIFFGVVYIHKESFGYAYFDCFCCRNVFGPFLCAS